MWRTWRTRGRGGPGGPEDLEDQRTRGPGGPGGPGDQRTGGPGDQRTKKKKSKKKKKKIPKKIPPHKESSTPAGLRTKTNCKTHPKKMVRFLRKLLTAITYHRRDSYLEKKTHLRWSSTKKTHDHFSPSFSGLPSLIR